MKLIRVSLEHPEFAESLHTNRLIRWELATVLKGDEINQQVFVSLCVTELRRINHPEDRLNLAGSFAHNFHVHLVVGKSVAIVAFNFLVIW